MISLHVKMYHISYNLHGVYLSFCFFYTWLFCFHHLQFAGFKTGHIPQVKSTGHCSIDKLPNHTDSPRSNEAFCKNLGLGDTFNPVSF